MMERDLDNEPYHQLQSSYVSEGVTPPTPRARSVTFS